MLFEATVADLRPVAAAHSNNTDTPLAAPGVLLPLTALRDTVKGRSTDGAAAGASVLLLWAAATGAALAGAAAACAAIAAACAALAAACADLLVGAAAAGACAAGADLAACG